MPDENAEPQKPWSNADELILRLNNEIFEIYDELKIIPYDVAFEVP